jgi:hypothetical protein
VLLVNLEQTSVACDLEIKYCCLEQNCVSWILEKQFCFQTALKSYYNSCDFELGDSMKELC